MSVNLDNYVEVKDRIQAFYEKHPEGSLQSTWSVEEVNGQTLIVVKAFAYRTPDDSRPGSGLASEPVPGLTPYTKNSELMNAETSAWGRAIASLGFKVDKGIASANEVRNRSGSESNGGAEASPAQKRLITTILNRAGVDRGWQKKMVHAIGGDPLTKGGASQILDKIADKQDDPAALENAVDELFVKAGVDRSEALADLPAETPALTTGEGEVPFE